MIESTIRPQDHDDYEEEVEREFLDLEDRFNELMEEGD